MQFYDLEDCNLFYQWLFVIWRFDAQSIIYAQSQQNLIEDPFANPVTNMKGIAN